MGQLAAQPTSCLFVLSGPCGTGKTSLAHAWRSVESDLAYTKSVTTRAPRGPDEEHYQRVTRDEFISMIHHGEFVQWIRPTYDEFYGTLRKPVEAAIAQGQDMVFDYCPEGTINLARMYPAITVSIFVMAPTKDELQRRLADRGTESVEEQKIRQRMALQDFQFVDQHRYHLINDVFQEALQQLRAIRVAEHARVRRKPEVLDWYRREAAPALLRYYDPAGS